MKCYFHSADFDGHCSGALVKMAHPEAELFGINYGDEFPWAEINQGETIYMVDFGLQPFSDMIRLGNISQLIWIDHHKTAIENAVEAGWEIDPMKLKIGVGACQLVWGYLRSEIKAHGYSGVEIPLFVKLLSEYDIWNHTDPRTLPFQYGMRMQKDTSPENQDFWRSLFNGNIVNTIIKTGKIILEYQANEDIKYCKSCAFETELDGLKCLAVNKMLCSSKIFDSMWDSDKYDAMITFGYRKGLWNFGLFTDKEGVDVSAVAKKYKGGGHLSASGFSADELPFELGDKT